MQSHHASKTRILDAALQVFRSQGYAGSTIDDVCREAELTKGSFFHHFKGKEDLALAAAAHFSQMADELFAHAPYQDLADPLDRVLAYVDFRRAILRGELCDYTCLLGTLVQETYETHPAIRAACEVTSAPMRRCSPVILPPQKRFTLLTRTGMPEVLGFYMQATIQGAFILAKAKTRSRCRLRLPAHLRRYLELLFNRQKWEGVN